MVAMEPVWLLAFLGGLLVAIVTVPVGVSGAVFLLPFQVSVLGVPSPAVTPTNLVFNVIAVPGALARYRKQGSLRSSLTAQLLLGTLPGVVAGALLRVFVVPDGAVFRVLVACLLFPLGGWLVLRAVWAPIAREERVASPAVVVALGVVAGVIGGIYGIGGGSLLAPVLVALGCSTVRVAPAALTSTFVTSCVGVAAYAALSVGQPQATPDWAIAIATGFGGLVGGYVGAALAPRVPVSLLTGLLGVLSAAVAVAYVLTSL